MLKGIRLDPIDLGVDRPQGDRGTPRAAGAGRGAAILRRLADLSAGSNTTIRIQDGAGIVDLAPGVADGCQVMKRTPSLLGVALSVASGLLGSCSRMSKEPSMHSPARRFGWRSIVRALALLLVVTALPVLVGRGQSIQSGQVSVEPQSRPRDAAQELKLKVTAPFTLASVGDVMIRRPASMLDDAGFQSAMKIIRDADIGLGNMEGNLSDVPHFEGPLRGMMGIKDVAADLKKMGFKMMNRANNHDFDSDREGMLATDALLDEAGIIHAGTGKNLEDARAPVFLDTPKGRIGLVAMHTPNGDPARQAASPQVGNTGGRPGLQRASLHHVSRRH